MSARTTLCSGDKADIGHCNSEGDFSCVMHRVSARIYLAPFAHQAQNTWRRPGISCRLARSAYMKVHTKDNVLSPFRSRVATPNLDCEHRRQQGRSQTQLPTSRMSTMTRAQGWDVCGYPGPTFVTSSDATRALFRASAALPRRRVAQALRDGARKTSHKIALSNVQQPARPVCLIFIRPACVAHTSKFAF